jgi:TatD DNase family protein
MQNPVCAASHSIEELDTSIGIAREFPGSVFLSFGIHPQNPDELLIPALEQALAAHTLHAIGETGFDLFTAEYKADIRRQEHAWRIQTDLAVQYSMPVIIHCRKALHLMFRDSAILAKIPACVFHSFAGSPVEAVSLLRRGVNAYFSFGKPLLNNNKRAASCVRELPSDRILAETDAPYQRLKNEEKTLPEDIVRVHERIAEIRGITVGEAAAAASRNFFAVFAQHA